MPCTIEIAKLKTENERAARAHDEAGRLGEDKTPYKVRLNELKTELEIQLRVMTDRG